MCGINGFLTSFQSQEINLNNALVECTNTISHRGPDSFGSWVDKEKGIYLAHRRLSILDLTPNGAQPMMSHNGRYVICLNGEIYNHIDLRNQLEQNKDIKITWKGSSDTETLINCIEYWGVKQTLENVNGMFALALWDNETNQLTIARDKFGEKPLYYGWQNKTFFFSSELKPIKSNPLFEARINRKALGLFVKYAYIPCPFSIYCDIQKLEPGTYLTVSLESKKLINNVYWSSLDIVKKKSENTFTGGKYEAIERLNNILTKAIEKQMISDVPLGAFLSGGVDSSTIVGIMQHLSDVPIKTFSIGFESKNYNEAVFAKKVAEHLGTDHTELYITENDALKVVPHLSHLYDEPFADSSQIPTYLVSHLAREKVTVSLSGDAADELFGGYNRYLLTIRLWKKISMIPLPIRKFFSKELLRVKPQTYNILVKRITFGKSLYNQSNIGDKIHKALGILASNSYFELYDKLVSSWNNPSSIVVGYQPSDLIKNDEYIKIMKLDPISQMMAIDLITYLPDDILCKVDRAAMGVSLETRVPYLDHNVMEFAWSLPLNYKIHQNKSKWILREVLYKYVPKELIERPKMGFGVPLDSWLRGELRDWAEALLDEKRLLREGFFNPKPIREKWEEHLSGKRNWHHQLWVILMATLMHRLF